MNSKIKQIIRKIGAAFFGFVLVSQAVAADAVLAAGTPVFTPDLPTLRVANKTDNQNSWSSSISADSGDHVAFDVYYRNSTEGSVAQNTKIKVKAPTSAQSYITATGYISADNASTISGTASINLGSQTGKITFGHTALWYAHNSQTGTEVSVTVDSDAGTAQVNIGDVEGECDEQGHVVFFATVTETSNPGLTITKTVRNITDGQSSYSSSVYADPGDRLGFKIVVNSTGQTAANNVHVSDSLPSGLIYQDALNISTGYSSGNIISDINLGTINSGSSVTITFEADVQSSLGTQTLTNYAYASATGVSQKQASANVYVKGEVIEENPNIAVTKTVRNITDGQSYYSNSVNADPGDRLGFKIVVNSTGQTAANNVHVSDSLPSGLIYQDALYVSSGYSSGNITSGINLGTISAGSSVTITFEADVQSSSYFGSGSQTLTNYAYASASNVSQRQATANVYVYGTTANNPNINITKSVRNITDGQTYYSNSVNADPGERLSFKIEVSSTGQTAASNVYVRDNLPAGLIYRDNVSVSTGYSSGNITSGINVGTLYVGNIVTITFEAEVQSSSYFGSGSQTLTNYAYASANNVSQRQATANVYVGSTVQTSSFTINKMVRNLTNGESGWQNSVQAKPGDQVEFYLNVTNTGNSSVSGLYVRDTLPVKMSYVGNVKLDGYYNSGNPVSESGLYIGDLSANQSKVVVFQAQVLGENYFGFGNTTVVNTATAYNTAGSVIDSAILVVNKKAVAGAETEVNTGLKEDLMSYFFLPALLAISLMFLLRNQLFKVDKWLAVRGAENRAYKSQRMLDQKIDKIREKESKK